MRASNVRTTYEGGARDLAERDDDRDPEHLRTARPGDGRSDLRRSVSRVLRANVAPVLAYQAPGSPSRGRHRSPWTGGTDGDVERPLGGAVGHRGPRFDAPVAKVGYRWFYLDAVSEDRSSSIVVIALLGNPFSPRYARARADGCASSLDHCAMNVAVDAPGLRRWALTERNEKAVRRDASQVSIGGSAMRRDASGAIVVDIDERAAPWGSRIRGRIRLEPIVSFNRVVTLDDAGEHDWCPRHPLARVVVELDEPRLRFTGTGYLDENSGVRPLETAFDRWSWSRVATDDTVAISYDVELRGGARRSHGLRLSESAVAPYAGGQEHALGRTRFALPRTVRSESSHASLVRTLEDGPFYARSVVETTVGGRTAHGIHETVCLERFASRWVQFLLPFRMRVEAA